jgi:hypothetical protein
MWKSYLAPLLSRESLSRRLESRPEKSSHGLTS